MPIYLGNTEIGKEYVDSYELGSLYLGTTQVEGLQTNTLPVINNGLISLYDFRNSVSYPGSGKQAYSLQSVSQLTNPIYTGSIDAIFTPPITSSVISSGSLGNMLYYPATNGYNNFRIDPGYPTILYDWSIVVACKYEQLPSTVGYAYAAIFSAQSNASTNHYVKYNSGSLSMEVFIDNIGFGASGSFALNQWHIIQVAVSGSGNPQIIWNIDNIVTGSAFYGPGLTTDIVNKKFTQNQIVTDNGGGKGYLQVMGLYNRQLTAAEMVTNFNLLNTRYGI